METLQSQATAKRSFSDKSPISYKIAGDSLDHLHARKEAAQPPPAVLTPKYTFASMDEYEGIYRAGTTFEAKYEAGIIEKFNCDHHVFRAWTYCKLRSTQGRQHWLFAIDAKTNPQGFPKEGDRCLIALYSDKEGEHQLSQDWSAVRIDSAQTPIKEHVFFKVSFPAHINAASIMTPIVDIDQPADQHPGLNNMNNTYAMLTLDHNDVTSQAELGALDALVNGFRDDEMVKSLQAFEYIRTFTQPASTVNLFDQLPHMRLAIDSPQELPSHLRRMVARLNPLQKAAYSEMLSTLPCGVGIIPGGPGGGKTFTNMFLAAMAQVQPLKYIEGGVEKTRRVKILYLLDINNPVDDATNKCVKMSEDLGDNKTICRMFGWGKELREGLKNRKRLKPSTVSSDPTDSDPTANFLFMVQMAANGSIPTTRSTCRAPSLDELAFKMFEENKRDWSELSELIDEYMVESAHFRRMNELRMETFRLYTKVLDEIDFVAATPVAATCLAGGKYKPDIILFDEAPHARELANLIALAHFQPMAWIFTGDFRQTSPYLASERSNPWAIPMKMSIMERAYHAGATEHELLMNHRSFGDLQALPSKMFYDGKMSSGIPVEARFPPSTKTLCKWMETKLKTRRFGHDVAGPNAPGPASDLEIKFPRAMVHLTGNPQSAQVGTSFWNPVHHQFVMQVVRALIEDPHFVSADGRSRGTVLIIAPYREAFLRYKKGIRDMYAELKRTTTHNNPKNICNDGDDDSDSRSAIESATETEPEIELPKVEARTVDTCQGHEADVVIVDLVREKATAFLDDSKRIAVATTRARQFEFYMMHPKMVKTLTRADNMRRLYLGCSSDQHGHVAWGS